MFDKETVANEAFPYHVVNRAVEGREIFVDEDDCYRFIFQMYAANVGRPTFNLHRRDVRTAAQALLTGKEIPHELLLIDHLPLVHVLSFALVVNHNHLCLVANTKNGISKYMQKLNCGFVRYFNLKHNRRGTLFESRYKKIPVQNDFQLSALKRYINVVNPLDVCRPGWREKGLENWKEAFECIKGYQFSSLPDLLGFRDSEVLAPKKILKRYYGEQLSEDKAEYARFIEDYLKQKLIDFYPIFFE